jgi:hypothetical protein
MFDRRKNVEEREGENEEVVLLDNETRLVTERIHKQKPQLLLP